MGWVRPNGELQFQAAREVCSGVDHYPTHHKLIVLMRGCDSFFICNLNGLHTSGRGEWFRRVEKIVTRMFVLRSGALRWTSKVLPHIRWCFMLMMLLFRAHTTMQFNTQESILSSGRLVAEAFTELPSLPRDSSVVRLFPMYEGQADSCL